MPLTTPAAQPTVVTTEHGVVRLVQVVYQIHALPEKFRGVLRFNTRVAANVLQRLHQMSWEIVSQCGILNLLSPPVQQPLPVRCQTDREGERLHIGV